MSLCDLKLQDKAIIKNINHSENIKRRLYDMGLTEGAIVKLILESPSKLIKGYLIRDSLIAIRNCDAEKILVRDIYG